MDSGNRYTTQNTSLLSNMGVIHADFTIKTSTALGAIQTELAFVPENFAMLVLRISINSPAVDE